MVEKDKTSENEKTEKPSWIKMKPAEFEKKVLELAKEGNAPAKIGLILRDKYGVPKSKVFGKKISGILEEHGVEYKTEEKIVREKIDNLSNHAKKNKKDYPASRALTKKLWLVRGTQS